jgi:hypothetical protein
VNTGVKDFAVGGEIDLRSVSLPVDHFSGSAPRVKNPRESAAYTHGYNLSTVAVNAQHLLQEIAKVRATGARVALVALNPHDAAVTAAAAAVVGPWVDALIIETSGFRFQNVRDIRDPMFFPSGAKYGDLPGLLALGAPRKLFLIGEGAIPPDIITAAYETAGVPDTLRVSRERDLDAAVKWLTEVSK